MLIHSLLEFGLETNKKSENFNFELSAHVYLLNNASNWQLYLAWLDWVGYKFQDSKDREELCEKAINLAEAFLRYGAERVTSVTVIRA